MQTVIYNKSNEIVGLGNPNANIQFCLPTPPDQISGTISVQEIVRLNGNHWRKIFVIIAKLLCKTRTWQQYRDEVLLNDVYLNFTDNLPTTNGLFFVCGKSHAERLNVIPHWTHWQSIDGLSKVKIMSPNEGQRIICTPYLDYRQFPNVLIEDVVNYLKTNTYA